MKRGKKLPLLAHENAVDNHLIGGLFSNDNFLIVTKILGDGNAVQVATSFAVVHGMNVEQDDQHGKQADSREQGQDDGPHFAAAILLAESDAREQGQGEEKAKDKPENVRVIVRPRKQAHDEEEQHHAAHPQHRHPGPVQQLPRVENLHENTRKHSELRPRRTNLENGQVFLGSICRRTVLSKKQAMIMA